MPRDKLQRAHDGLQRAHTSLQTARRVVVHARGALKLAIRTAKFALQNPTREKPPHAERTALGVTRSAFLWRVVEMSHKPGASNILLCKRSFTPELLAKIEYQINTVRGALLAAFERSIVYTTRVVHNDLEILAGGDDQVERPELQEFLVYLITLGYDVCNAMVETPDDHLPPKNWTHYQLIEDTINVLHEESNIVRSFSSVNNDLVFQHEPPSTHSDYHEHEIMYSDDDCDNEHVQDDYICRETHE